MMQKECFTMRLLTLEPFKDEHDIKRVKTKIIYRKNSKNFNALIVVLLNHEIVKRLILQFSSLKLSFKSSDSFEFALKKKWILNTKILCFIQMYHF